MLLATAAVGAVFSSTAPDMGTQGIVERYSQFQPKLFVCETQVRYNGKHVNLRPVLTAALSKLEQVVPDVVTIVARGPLISGKNV